MRVSEHIFGSADVEKWHVAVARSTFESQNVKNMRALDHFLKLGCGKIARRCSEKRVCKSTCTKHIRFGSLFKAPMSKGFRQNR